MGGIRQGARLLFTLARLLANVEQCLASIRHQRLSLTRDHAVLEGERSLYDDFSYSHALTEHSAHRNAYFLPWRAFRPSPLLLPQAHAYVNRRPLVHLPI